MTLFSGQLTVSMHSTLINKEETKASLLIAAQAVVDDSLLSTMCYDILLPQYSISSQCFLVLTYNINMGIIESYW